MSGDLYPYLLRETAGVYRGVVYPSKAAIGMLDPVWRCVHPHRFPWEATRCAQQYLSTRSEGP